jgi:Fungal Zn(2)-Cys(6) binuclear cluster domain
MDNEPHRARSSKACQECRRRKTKCNGEVPCLQCQRHGARCIYRNLYRGEEKTGLGQIPHHQKRNHRVSSVNGASPQADSPGGTHMHQGVTASHLASSSCVLQHYYGASSNFAFLQKIHESLSAESRQQPSQDNEVDEGAPGLDKFSQRNLFFGTANGSRSSLAPENKIYASFLSYDLAQSFLHAYLQTLYHLQPLQSPTYLQELLARLYGQSHSIQLGVEDSALIMSVIAIGATLTEYLNWGEILMGKVKTATSHLDEAVNLRAVQVAILAISVSTIFKE